MGTAAKIKALIACGECATRKEAIEYLWDMGEISGDAAQAALEREVRLDEARIADEMERESVRGISPPDY